MNIMLREPPILHVQVNETDDVSAYSGEEKNSVEPELVRM
jgi:hypothetical protein